jgi:hypothetical protein
MIAAFHDLIREICPITISEIAMELKISVVSVHTVVAEELHYTEACERWIPTRLTPEIKKRRTDMCS